MSKRVAVGVLEGTARRLWGFPPRLMPYIVEELGGTRALGWFLANMPRYEATRKQFGPMRTHVLSVGISLLNGCPYCTYAHAYPLQLLYLERFGRLFPLDEHEIVGLHRLGEGELLERLRGALREAGLTEEVPVLDRMVALRGGAPGGGAQDARIAHLLRMFSVLNACGIKGDVQRDEAHDPINRDRELWARYRALRGEGAAA